MWMRLTGTQKTTAAGPSLQTVGLITSLGGCVDDNGDELLRFLGSSHECAWFGVTCSTDVADMSADKHSLVTCLELQAHNLGGYIPKDVGLLYTTLEVLDL
jgi:hypothetical protein